ncbi:succinate dehydrogenase, hydrophobic membrane anchor protein [Rhodobacter ferrooxidans]|uniref:Succinate dehydrogenase, hydrophobic membrane anchor protein n=1 Tax=Rhodobacter ferrooxidans TaxID=371731 RepID=C8S3C7_9RHOB|nr:succinate dehydrogenase hydrophobic membrane anchor protein [Rhodobacter sp. SW2]EEW24492.1 succinate dehydrogenase, hydrophobic membrane anchor protein [Rhodobacter sp. SW2]
MRFITDRKTANGKGSAHSGTHEHKDMALTSIGLAFLMPTFLFIFGRTLGQPHEVVVATFGRPIPAIVTGLMVFLAMRHMMHGVGSVLADYTRGTARRLLTIFVNALAYLITAAVLYALIRMAH